MTTALNLPLRTSFTAWRWFSIRNGVEGADICRDRIECLLHPARLIPVVLIDKAHQRSAGSFRRRRCPG